MLFLMKTIGRVFMDDKTVKDDKTFKSDTYPDDYKINVNYTDSNGNEREIHFENGKPHVHYDTDKARAGEISWESTGHHDLDETDKYVLTVAAAEHSKK